VNTQLSLIDGNNDPALAALERKTDVEVYLMDFTGAGRIDQKWHAADLLIFTKQTRLEMDMGGLLSITHWPEQKKLDELALMAATIRSSWEFVDVTFLIRKVSRACAQQITRTRTGSYAMQSQRVVDVSSSSVYNPMKEQSHFELFADQATGAIAEYAELVADGASREDARGILPMNIHCNLVAKYNLRAFADLVVARSSLRTQGEYADIIAQMRQAVIDVWPWAEIFFEPKNEKAIKMLEAVANRIGITTGSGDGWDIAKAIDLLRAE
jgi:flavin-dependent thymidylate synthase